MKLGEIRVEVHLNDDGQIERYPPAWLAAPTDPPPEAPSPAVPHVRFGSSEAGRHGNHVRRAIVDASCQLCSVAATDSDPRSDIAATDSDPRSDIAATDSDPRSDIAASLSDSEVINSDQKDLTPPSALPKGGDGWGDRADFAALRARRWKHPPAGQDLALLDHIAGSSLTGPDAAAGQRWIAGVIATTPKGKKLIEVVASAFRELEQRAPAPPARGGARPTPAASSVREAVLKAFQDMIERGEQLSPQAAAEYERLRGPTPPA